MERNSKRYVIIGIVAAVILIVIIFYMKYNYIIR